MVVAEVSTGAELATSPAAATGEEDQREPVDPEGRSPVEQDRGHHECGCEYDELDPREGCCTGEDDERELRHAAGSLERLDPEEQRCEHERVGDGVGRDEGGERDVRDEQRERCAGKGEAGAEVEAPCEQVGGHRRE